MTEDTLEYMRDEIEKHLISQTGIPWTVTVESERLDFQFTAKTDEDEKYAVRSASLSMLDLSEVTIPLMLGSQSSMMLAHYKRTMERM